MHQLTDLIRSDMKPALGVTEPGAIAYAAAKARSCLTEPVQSIHVTMNSGMYKNAFTCGIPNSLHFGAAYAAALGAIAGKAELELEALRDITPADNEAAEALVKEGKVSVSVSEITSRIYIRATVRAGGQGSVRHDRRQPHQYHQHRIRRQGPFRTHGADGAGGRRKCGNPPIYAR